MATAVTEKVQLLGKGLYKDIPDEITLRTIPTASELDYVGGDDFDKVMLEKILPAAIVEDINFNELLEVDYQWICRCLRILNYGPYHTTNRILCSDCGEMSFGEYQVNLKTIECVPFPNGFKNTFTLHRDEFINFEGEVTFKLPTIKEMLSAYNDKTFQDSEGKMNRSLARLCYMITSIGDRADMIPLEIKAKILNEFSSADYIILKDTVAELSDYGLRAGGSCQCPNCGSMNGTYIALVDDRFFRPTVGNLRKWRDDTSSRKD